MMNSYPIIDLHCDTSELVFTENRGKGNTLLSSTGHIDIPRLRRGNSLVQAMAIFAPEKRLPYLPENYEVTEYYHTMQSAFAHAMQEYSDRVEQVWQFDDIRRIHDSGKQPLLLTLEDSAVLKGDRDKLDMLKKQGVRIMSLTWNFENCTAYPNAKDPKVMGAGLKPFGRDVVEYMQSSGMIVDVSHLSDGGFWDVAQMSRKPFIASHSCCRALCGHTRNLTDEMLRAIGEAGGVVGVSFCAMFLREDHHNCSSIEDVLAHMRHARDKAGLEAVALGSDFDGIDDELEFRDFAGLQTLLQAAEKYFTADELERISYKNALRVFRDCF